MKKISNWFMSGPKVQYGFDMRGVTQCCAIATVVLAVAVLHRALGFWFPNELPIRLLERDMSSALPSTIEHLLCAFALVAMASLVVCGTKSTTRVRLMACLMWSFAYTWLSTFGWDWHQYVVGHDPAQLAQMAGDIAGVLSATYWLTRPVRIRRHASRFRASEAFR